MGAVTVVVVKLETSGGIHGWIFLSLYSLDRISFHGTRRLLFNPPFSLAFSLRHVTLVFFFHTLRSRFFFTFIFEQRWFNTKNQI